MIYLDNSATTNPKPLKVIKAVDESLRLYCANPGRSGHDLSINTAKKVFECRQAVCDFFNIDDESKVVFTSSCTQALNTVIKGVLKSGDHCIISCLEHNSVLRPLEKLRKHGVSYSVAQFYQFDDDRTVDSFRKLINERTKLIVCTHASNVFGFRLPIERLCALAHEYGVLFCLDAAQSAGVLDVDVGEYGYDYVCCAGHKGLYGPMGVGVLIVNCGVVPDSLIEGGTGSESQNYNQPEFSPDRFESGTLNIPGICGLKNGIDFVRLKGRENIFMSEMKHVKKIHGFLSQNKRIKLYSNKVDFSNFAPVLSFCFKDTDSEEVAKYLNNRFRIAVRAGLHCAPLAHKYMDTLQYGTIRVSPSVFTTEKDINILINAINKF